MTKEQKILEILNSKPTQKIGLDDFYGRQTVTNMLEAAINFIPCCANKKEKPKAPSNRIVNNTSPVADSKKA